MSNYMENYVKILRFMHEFCEEIVKIQNFLVHLKMEYDTIQK